LKCPILLCLIDLKSLSFYLKKFNVEILDSKNIENTVSFPVNYKSLTSILNYIYSEDIELEMIDFNFSKMISSMENYFHDLLLNKDESTISKIRSILDTEIEIPLKSEMFHICEISREIVDVAFSDFKFFKDKKEILLHKIVLASNSLYFEKLFSVKMNDQHSNEFMDSDEDTIIAFCNLVYFKNKTIITNENAVNLLILSNYYEAEQLKHFIQIVLKSFVEPDNVITLYFMCIEHNSPILEEYCKQYITENQAKVKNSESWKKLTKKEIEFHFK
jgi:hypothetical protein